MSKSLIIVESPAKAKTISKYLGRGYKVEASMGHLRDLPKSQLGINVEDGFTPKYITIRGKGPLLNNLKKEASKVDNVLLATDPDREGEAISWHLAHLLRLPEDSSCRVDFFEITKNAVTQAVKKPRKININLVEAQQARRFLDRLVGYKISPILWRKVRWGLSAGRVQSVALRIILDREKEIRQFVEREYWTIDVLLKDEKSKSNVTAKLHSKGGKKIEIDTEQESNVILEDLKKQTYLVTKIKKSERKRLPSLPFTTSALQQEASRKLKFTAKKTMLVAQQLYEGLDVKGEGMTGLVTYIRTDSTRISDIAKKEAHVYIKNTYGKEYVSTFTIAKKNTAKTQDAHEAIRPTSLARHPEMIEDSLSKDQYRLYKLIWDRFVSSQMSAAIYDTVSVDIKSGDYTLKLAGSNLRFAGYLILYEEGSDEVIAKDDTKLPPLEEGQYLKLIKLLPKQHFTEPPVRYSEAMLVKTLEEKGIGRPSTYAPIIDTIQKRDYVEKEKGRFKPTELGEIIINIMQEFFSDIVDIDFSAAMEAKLDRVEEGSTEKTKLLEEFYTPFEKKLRVAEQEIQKVNIEDEVTDIKCDLCGRNMVIKRGKFGRFLACPGFPDCKNTKPLLTEIGVKCPKCGGNIVLRRSKKGRIFYGCDNYPECKFVSWDQPIDKRCPECGSIMAIKKSKKGDKEVCTNKECGYQAK